MITCPVERICYHRLSLTHYMRTVDTKIFTLALRDIHINISALSGEVDDYLFLVFTFISWGRQILANVPL